MCRSAERTSRHDTHVCYSQTFSHTGYRALMRPYFAFRVIGLVLLINYWRDVLLLYASGPLYTKPGAAGGEGSCAADLRLWASVLRAVECSTTVAFCAALVGGGLWGCCRLGLRSTTRWCALWPRSGLVRSGLV